MALVDGQPRLLNLKQMLDYFLQHRREVVTRRTVFQLRKARERGHVLEGRPWRWPTSTTSSPSSGGADASVARRN